MIEFKNVSFFYEKNEPVLNDISLRINDGESVGIIGANGAGKSTLMKALLGLIITDGEITVAGIPVNKENLQKVRRELGFVLQDSDNQMFMPTVYEDMAFAPRNYGHTEEETDERITEVLKDLGLLHLKNKYNHKISGGEKRMAAIATILTMRPHVMIMDEPTTALDPVNRRTVINTVNKLPMTKIIVSHDLDMILDTCNRVVLLSNGTVVADGPAREILHNQELLEANRMELPLCLQGQR